MWVAKWPHLAHLRVDELVESLPYGNALRVRASCPVGRYARQVQIGRDCRLASALGVLGLQADGRYAPFRGHPRPKRALLR